MLLDPRRLGARVADRRRAARRSRRDVADHAAAETHGSALELFSRPARDRRAARRRSSRELRAGLAADLAPLGLRAAVAGTHPFAQWSDVEVSPGARYQSIYDSMRELARREPTFALHVHVAVPGPRGGGPRAARAARARAAAARARRELAVLAGPRHRPRVGARARLRHVPARRHPAAVRRLRRVRRGDRRAAALRRLPRADVPVVGRAAAAEARHDRGADHGRPDARGRQRGARRARPVRSCGSRRLEGYADEEIARRPEVLDENRFLATRDGMRAEFIDPERDGRRPARDDPRASCSPRSGRTPRRSAARPSWPRCPRSPPSPATTASGCSPASRRATRSGPGSAAWSPRWRPTSAPGCRRRPSPSASG